MHGYFETTRVLIVVCVIVCFYSFPSDHSKLFSKLSNHTRRRNWTCSRRLEFVLDVLQQMRNEHLRKDWRRKNMFWLPRPAWKADLYELWRTKVLFEMQRRIHSSEKQRRLVPLRQVLRYTWTSMYQMHLRPNNRRKCFGKGLLYWVRRQLCHW